MAAIPRQMNPFSGFHITFWTMGMSYTGTVYLKVCVFHPFPSCRAGTDRHAYTCLLWFVATLVFGNWDCTVQTCRIQQNSCQPGHQFSEAMLDGYRLPLPWRALVSTYVIECLGIQLNIDPQNSNNRPAWVNYLLLRCFRTLFPSRTSVGVE